MFSASTSKKEGKTYQGQGCSSLKSKPERSKAIHLRALVQKANETFKIQVPVSCLLLCVSSPSRSRKPSSTMSGFTTSAHSGCNVEGTS